MALLPLSCHSSSTCCSIKPWIIQQHLHPILMASQALTLHTHIPTPQQVLHGHQALIQPCCHILTLACMLAVCQDILITWQDALHLVLLTSMLLLR